MSAKKSSCSRSCLSGATHDYSQLVGEKSRRVTAIHHLEQRCLQGSLTRGVVTILRPWQAADPGFGAVTDQAAAVDSQYVIGDFGLSIGLGSEC